MDLWTVTTTPELFSAGCLGYTDLYCNCFTCRIIILVVPSAVTQSRPQHGWWFEKEHRNETKAWWNVMNVMDLYRFFCLVFYIRGIQIKFGWAVLTVVRKEQINAWTQVIPHYQKAASDEWWWWCARFQYSLGNQPLMSICTTFFGSSQ